MDNGHKPIGYGAFRFDTGYISDWAAPLAGICVSVAMKRDKCGERHS